jgi:uncharacterized surface protein with fasciclin (FAS1) repeats
MKKINILSGIKPLFILLFMSFLHTSCEKDENRAPSIAAIAVSNPNFSILEDAAVRGGVVGVLSNKNPNDVQGNFTVFAPTNTAFARLGLNNASDLTVLQKSFLTNTLVYHVSNGSLSKTNIKVGNMSPSLLGVNRRFIQRGNDIYINGSKITATDIAATNGTIHVIDKVILATGADIVQSALALRDAKVFTTPQLTFLVEALIYCDLVGALSETAKGFTVFAPTDQAFKDLGVLLSVPLNIPSDIRKLPKETVTKVLLNHVIADGGKFTSEFLENAAVQSIDNTTITIGMFNNGAPIISGKNNKIDARMVIPDIQCTNGVVHLIDRVLLP